MTTNVWHVIETRVKGFQLRDTILALYPGGSVTVYLFRQPPEEGQPSGINLRACQVGEGERGRVASNVVLMHGDTCGEECESGCPVQHLREHIGWTASSGEKVERKTPGNTVTFGGLHKKGTTWVRHDEGGTVDRFFPVVNGWSGLEKWLIDLLTPP